MSTLTYSESGFAPAPATAQGEAAAPIRRSFWRRFYDALVASQERRAEREIGAYIARHGGLLTDDVEREIMRGLSNGRR